MKQRIIQFNSAVIGNNFDKAAFMSLAVLLGIAGFFYLYFVGSAIFFTVERKMAESDIRNISARVGALEIEHLKISNSISLEYARALGFKEAGNQVFVPRKGSAKAVSLSGNGN